MAPSLSARRAWIENGKIMSVLSGLKRSLSARRAWIENDTLIDDVSTGGVALRKESVDRKLFFNYIIRLYRVALRKESVDRKHRCWCARYSRYWSLSARRAWIEKYK